MGYFDDDDVLLDNEEIAEELNLENEENLVVYSRDWTIETIYNQISQGNIELNPKFQRRNAWNDVKRSRLIESILLGVPIPEIVLAEMKGKKRKYLVIDGKQRLLTIAGFIDNNTYNYWNKSKLQKIKSKKKLNNVTYEILSEDLEYQNEFREFMNSDIRCTVISNYSKEDILYDIFYRLNSGSTPLAMQELRQVLNKGYFADYLFEITNTIQPLHKLMKLTQSDNRLLDIEIILKFISFTLFNNQYTGNLKSFLDESMRKINEDWSKFEKIVDDLYKDFNESIEKLKIIFGDNVGKKFKNSKYEVRLNKTLLEVQAYFFLKVNKDQITTEKSQNFKIKFENLCESETSGFLETIESSTKAVYNYKNRFKLFGNIVKEIFNIDFEEFINAKI